MKPMVAARPSRLHVLISVNAMWNVTNFRRPIVAALLAEGHRVTVLAPPDAQAASTLSEMGCRVLPLKLNPKGINPLAQLAFMRRLKRIFRDEQPDVILSYTIKNNIFGAFAARALGIPFLPNLTGLGTAFLSGGLMEGVARALYTRAFAGLPCVFFQNSDDEALFVDQGMIQPHQSRILPGSGIDLDVFDPRPLGGTEEAPVFLMIARLLRDKGVEEFAAAARKTKRRLPGARFQLLGALGVSNRSAIPKVTLDQWVAEGLIEYLGTVDDVRPVIEQASCVVLPSYREGAPRTLIEAAAMARPVIATDVPGCRTVVDDGRSGFLCAPRSSDSLAFAMERFIDLPLAARAEMGALGRSKMEREFDQAIVVEAYLDAIAELTATAPFELTLATQTKPAATSSPAEIAQTP